MLTTLFYELSGLLKICNVIPWPVQMWIAIIKNILFLWDTHYPIHHSSYKESDKQRKLEVPVLDVLQSNCQKTLWTLKPYKEAGYFLLKAFGCMSPTSPWRILPPNSHFLLIDQKQTVISIVKQMPTQQ